MRNALGSAATQYQSREGPLGLLSYCLLSKNNKKDRKKEEKAA